MRVTFDDLFKKIGVLVIENDALREEVERLKKALDDKGRPVPDTGEEE